MKKKFVNPRIKLKATIAELRKEIKEWKRKFNNMNKSKDRTIKELTKRRFPYKGASPII